MTTQSDEKRVRTGYHIAALAKGLQVMALFSESRTALRLSDIAAETGMLMPTVYRVSMTLAEEGFLEHLPDGRYRPGARVLTLGFSALRSLDLVELATSRLQRLAARSGETVNLAILLDDKVLYLVRLRNADLITANVQVGSTLPAVHTSLGKLLLAYQPLGDLDTRITPTSFVSGSGPGALKSIDELRKQLDVIRSQGYAVQDEELASGLRSVAAPIRNSESETIAAANVAVNAMDWPMDRLLTEAKPLVVETCAEISHLLGYR